MCGIIGIIGERPDQQTLTAMNDTLVHRGPDGQGILIGDTFGFAHRRLAIVDLSQDGTQPMEKYGRYTIVYNGEIYNHPELRAELETAGHKFTGRSDTEVILSAFAEWGPDCLSRFNGMWAFCIYDKETEQFFFARDRFGIKPLYLARAGNVILFASEMSALAAYPAFELVPKPETVQAFLQSGPKEFQEDTIFRNVTKLPAAHFLHGTAERLLAGHSPQRFWALDVNTHIEPFSAEQAQQYALRYYDILKDAVKIRLRADVAVGSALSGGLDSSSVVYLINEIHHESSANGGASERGAKQKTFSCVFQSPGTTHCDESDFINQLSDELGVDNFQTEPLVKDVISDLDALLSHLESPPHSTLLSTWHTYKLTHGTGIKVTLDGQGADEQLGGYMGYVNSYLTSLPIRDFYREARQFWRNPQARKHIIASFPLVHLRPVLGKKLCEKIATHVLGTRYQLNLNARLADDVQENLQTLFHYCDRTSMAWSVESRLPFMDYRLIEWLASIPASYKLHNGWTKYLARLAFSGKLPDEIVWRVDKMGWPIPEDHWFRGELREWMRSAIAESKLITENAPSFDFDKEVATKQGLALMVRYLNLARTERALNLSS